MSEIRITVSRIVQILLFVTVGVFAFSCSNYDARWFQNGNGSSSSNTSLPADEGTQLPAEDKDPFKQADTPTENGGGFSAAQFKEWRITASFDGANVPTYKFTGTGWANQDISTKSTLKNPGVQLNQAYMYSGPNTQAGGNGISNVKYYQFRNQHPMYPNTYSYNQNPHAERLERFYFYWFEGDTAAPHLSNALIAVDSYSKLVYAYAKPIETKILLGNSVPTKWGAFEVYSTGPGGNAYKFYEYDPIGYVKADGTVTLYSWYTTAQAAAQYDPRMQYIGGAVASASGPGRSPYAPMTISANDTQAPASGTLTVKSKKLKNISVKTKTYSKYLWDAHYTFRAEENKGYYVYAMNARAYDGYTAPKYDMLAEKNKGAAPSALVGRPSIVTTAYPLSIGDEVTFTKEKSYTFSASTKDMTLNLSLDATRYNFESAWMGIYGLMLKEDYMDSNTISYVNIATGLTFPFQYDRTNDSWKVGDNSFSQGTTVQYDKAFVLSKGETKDFTITLLDSAGSTTQFVYTLTWN